jgi:hypothetical protein
MRRLFGLSMMVCLAANGAIAFDAPPLPSPVPAPCPQEEVVYHDVLSHRCKLVPETKQIKKTVYEVQEVPFCLKRLPPLFSHHQHDCCEDCAMCAECACPRYKKVLVKKEVVCKEICGSKCVVEEFVERVPCRSCSAPCPTCGTPCAPTCATPVQTGGLKPVGPSALDSLISAPPLPLPPPLPSGG